MICSRRDMFALAAAPLALLPVAARAAGASAPGGKSGLTAYVFSFEGLQGGSISLAAFSGKPFMVVNTASLCGYTPQYGGLQALYRRYKDRGFGLIGVPSNDFGGQEPGTPKDILAVAHEDYGVTFPLTAKTVVRGANANRFYKWAAAERPAETPQWNFHKYLIGTDGYIAAVFPTGVEPGDPRIAAAIEKQLGAQG